MGAFGPVVDAHQHFWDPGTGWYDWLDSQPDSIRHAFDFDDLVPHLVSCGVAGTVVVQSADRDEDTDAMFDQAAAHPEILGVVGYVPLHEPERAAVRLAELQGRERFVGVRNLIHDRPDPDWLRRPDVLEGLSLLEAVGLPFDVVAVLPRHLEHVSYLSERFPHLRMVVDHLAKPPVGGTTREPWRTLIRAAAQNPRVVAKVSGLYPVQGEPTAWQIDDLRLWVDEALDAFGPQRLMVGSDWPVAVLAGDYERVFGALLKIVAGYGPDVARPLLSGTAVATYNLRLPA